MIAVNSLEQNVDKDPDKNYRLLTFKVLVVCTA